MLYIRADGNAEIGTGHVMRCLAIAKAVAKHGEACTFITADKNMESLLIEQGFHSICLDSAWNDLCCETEKMVSLISERQIKKLLVDSYFVTSDYLKRLCGLAHIIYIDDLNAFHYPCHTLINYNIYADKFNYPAHYPDTKLLLGPKYAPLREEFQNLPQRVIREKAEAVMVTTGGNDLYNVAGKLVKSAKESPGLKHFEFHIVAGRFNANLPMLQDLAKRYDGVIIHASVQKMSQLMLSCDIAVSSAGSTLYELCASGLPSVIFACADNQLDAIDAFDSIMINAGDIRYSTTHVISKIIHGIQLLSDNPQKRQDMADSMHMLVDGAGALRITGEL